MSTFVSDGSEPETLDLVAERILDAALEQFRLAGIRRSSVQDIARRAGVSRVTVYRRFPQKDALVRAMAAREARRVIAAIDAQTGPVEPFCERIAEGFLAAVRAVRAHPVIRQLLAVEPDELLRYLTIDGEQIIAIATEYAATQIRRAQRDGDAPHYDPEPVAEILARLIHSLLLTPTGGIPLEDEQRVRAFARAHLAPLIARYDSASTSSRTAPGSR